MANMNSIERVYGLTPMQEGMLFHSLLEKESHDYFVQTCMNFEGNLCIRSVKESFNLLSYKHDVLRTLIFHSSASKPRQVVLKERDVEIKEHDLSEQSKETQDNMLVKIKQGDVERGFNLEKDSLLRINLIKKSDMEYMIIWSFHHIIMDGWCLSLLYGDFVKFYNELVNGIHVDEIKKKVTEEKKTARRYEDYIKWLEKQDKDEGMRYWANVLDGYESEAKILKTGIIQENTGRQVAEKILCLSKELSEKIKKFSIENGVTVSHVMESAWGILLQKYSNNDDVVFGKVVSGRNANIPGIEQMVGLFINTVPERIRVNRDTTIEELLNSTRKQAIESERFDYCPLAEVQGLTGMGSRLISTLYVYENYFVDEGAKQEVSGIKIAIDDTREQTNYAITISISFGEIIRISMLYNPDEYSEAEADQILSRMNVILEAIAQDASVKVSDIDVLSIGEKDQILHGFNNTYADFPKDKTVVDIFEEQVLKTPDKIMAVFEDREVSYKEMNELINQAAHKLRNMGVQPDDFVAIMAERSIEMIVGVYAIIKAGGAYVPVDPTYPEDRIKYMLSDCKPRALVVYNAGIPDEIDMPTLDLSDMNVFSGDASNPKKVNTPNNLLYLIYTSGTTGKPKGVMIEHRNLINLVMSYKTIYDMTQDDTVLQFASLSFDQSVWDIFNITLIGGTLCLMPYSYIGSPRQLEDYMNSKNVTIAALTPAYLRELCVSNLPRLKTVESGGAAADITILKEWGKTKKVFNTYGPTEATVNALSFALDDKERLSIPIGKPIANSQIYILNGLNLCGIGIPGELCIAGFGLSRGYLNHPELTEQKFIDNPFGEGRLYRTGDLARWLPDGNVEYMGRIDEQVKIRGFRVELGEIESVILKQQNILDVAVITIEDESKDKYIAAYIVGKDRTVDIDELRENLKKVLPDYMVPAYFMEIDKIPVTSNGKLNKKALPEIVVASTREYKAPKNETEKKVAGIFEEVLNVEKVGVKDNFFEIGGHSLRATRVMNRIEAETGIRLPLKEMFVNPTVEMLSLLIDKAAGSAYESIPKAEKKESYPMSSTQKRIFVIHEMDTQETAYNMPAAIEMGGNLDKNKIENVFRNLIKRHELLRTSFFMEDGEPIQRIADNVEAEVEYKEVIGATEEQKKEIFKAFIRPFDLGKAPLMRIKVVKTDEEKNILLFDMHHIISDGVSTNIIEEEFSTLYNGGKLEELSVQYKDFSEWMRTRNLSSQKEYWLKQFSDDIPVLDLPLDFNRPQLQSYKGKAIRKYAGLELRNRIEKLAYENYVTEYMVLLSGFMMLLGRYSRQQDIVVGSPISGRVHKDTENMLGMFVNTLAMRGKPESDKTYGRFLGEIKETCLKAYENQEYPFEELVEQVNIKRDLSRNPLFDVMLVLQNNEVSDAAINGVNPTGGIEGESTVAKFDITVNVDRTEKGYMISFEYCTDLFSQESIEVMADHYISILEEIAENQDKKIIEYEGIMDTERKKLIAGFNETRAEYPYKTVVELFEEQVEKTPDHIAVVYNEDEITYRELNKQANQIAHKLRTLGVKPDDFVAMMTERSIEMITGIYGIIKAGAAYVPIDPAYPKDRIEYMLHDCKPKAILQYKAEVPVDIDAPVIDLSVKDSFIGDNGNPERVNTPKDLIYLIYTSGTTGRPKGVMIEHENVVRLFKNDTFQFDFDDRDTWMMFHYYGFDFSVWEMYGATLFGGKLIVPTREEVRNPYNIVKLLEKHKITVLNQVPSAFYSLMSEMNSSESLSVRYLIFGGEALDPTRLKEWHKDFGNVKIINMYGITETTVHVTYREITDVEILKGISDIGSAIPTLQAYIMNEMSSCGIGIPGELCIAGAGLGRGYLNQPELTAKKFISNPFSEGRLYRTGDLARWLPDGNIEYLGRIDEQVKIRGFRIELGEIASVIRKQPGIEDAVVIVREDKNKEKFIAAFLVGKDRIIDLNKLREGIRKELPEYMIPAYFMEIEKIPVTGNGKLNKKALPEIEVISTREYIAPRTLTQETVARIFSEVLNIEKVGICDNFFEIGGHSLRATRVMNRIETETGVKLPLKDIFSNPTVEALSSLIDESNYNTFEAIPKAKDMDYYPMSSAQKRLYVIHQMDEEGTAYNMPACIEMKGQIDKAKISQVFKKLIGRHEVLRTSFTVIEEEAVQYIAKEAAAEIEYEEAINATFKQKKVIYERFVRPFDLKRAPLMRIKLVKIGEETNLLMFDMHHIISDGMSMNLIIEEFGALYNGEELKETGVQYKDYSEWMRTRDLSSQKDYWIELFRDEIPVLDLPLDYKRPQIKSYRGKELLKHTGMDLKNKIASLAKDTGTTEYMVLLSGLMVLLGKYGRSEDMVIGSPISGRTHRDTENMLGMFVNTLAMRGKPARDKIFREFLSEIRDSCLKAYESQEYPFEELVEEVEVKRDLSRNPLFDVMLVLQNNEQINTQINGMDAFRDIKGEDRVAKFDITANINATNEGYNIIFEYCTDLFKEDSIEGMADHYISILGEITENPDRKICEYKGFEKDEMELLLHTFNNTGLEYPLDKTVTEIFEEQVEKAPDNIAAVYEDEKLTYGELNKRANQLAHRLRSMGVKSEDFVAIIAERSIELITGILGVMKSGGAYVPIDPRYPSERITYMLNDCCPKVILTYKADVPAEVTISTIDLEETELYTGKTSNPIKVNSPDDLIYVIYTSGTTGKPKGVMIEHKGVNNLREYFIRNQGMTYSDRTIQFASMAFDAMVSELSMSLLVGGCLYIAPENVKLDTAEFESYVDNNNITAMILPPQYVMNLNLKNGPRTIITAGSETNGQIVEKIAGICGYSNDYGPTECTVCATHWEYKNNEIILEKIPIGKPIANKQIYIMNDMTLCGIGIPGELCIAGVGLARGYLNQPELTKDKFISNPFGEGRLYRTGDLARWLPDGNIEYSGRIDEQVKIRGYRIELMEIESVIRNQSNIEDAAVIAKEDKDGEKYIAAYIVSKDKNVDISILRENIRKKLPDYMVPAYFMEISSIPLTRNGKLDKNALPDVEAVSNSGYYPPTTEAEITVAGIFAKVLNTDKVGIRDNFFEIGGHSLRATKVINQIEAEMGVRLPLKEMFANPTVEALAMHIENAGKSAYERIPKAEERQSYPMSSTQKRLFVISEMDQQGTTYNMPLAVEMDGDLVKEKVLEAFQKLIDRHEVLRTSFFMDGTEPVQYIEKDVKAAVEYQEMVGADEEQKKEIYERFIRPFDLGKAPLIRIKVVKVGDKKNLLLFDMHHIISDGMSMNIVQQEFSTLYNGGELADLRVQYKDYSEWMRNRNLSGQKDYWISQFSDDIPVLDLPIDFTRPQIQSFRGKSVGIVFSGDLKERIAALSKKTGATDYMIFLSGFMVLLRKYSHQEDIVVGSPISGRTHKDMEGMLGMFVNTLAMRGKPLGMKTYMEFLQEVKESCLKAYENQEYPFEELVEVVNINRDLSRNPLFDVMLVLQNNEQSGASMEGVVSSRGLEAEDRIAKFDITVNIDSTDNGYRFIFEYCTDLFRKESIERMTQHFIQMLEDITNNPDKRISEFEGITEKERNQILNDFNNTDTDYPGNKTVVELFEEQVDKTPDAVAVTYKTQKISYCALNERSNHIAYRLRSIGVNADDCVAIMAERSIEMLAGILGIIKAGGAYVPIDPTYPAERIRYILEDCNPKALLIYKTEVNGDINIPVIDLMLEGNCSGCSTNPARVNIPASLIYVIYTSGTTGKPKGSLIEHRSVVRLVKNTNYINLNEGTVVLQTGAISFDASTLEVWGSLLNGGKLVLTDNETLVNPIFFRKTIEEERVNTIWLTSTLFNQMIDSDPGMFDTLEYLLVGGEKLSENHVRKLKERNTNVTFINGYGPTENTTFTTTYKVPDSFDSIPIGKPISNTKVYILNGMYLCGIGVPGELCAAGAGLARGYLNQTDLTNEKFISNPFGEGKLYKTGDLARWLPDGNIEYLGRIDEQVKIRGFRIELGEIESVLRKRNEVEDAVVVDRVDKNDEKYIAAFIVGKDDSLDLNRLREDIRKELPDYMIPGYFTVIEKIPVTRNGKLDKRALPETELLSMREYVAPRNEKEGILSKVFEEILGMEKIGVLDNFFELGGDSIKAIRIVSKLREYEYNLDVKSIMQGRTVEGIAAYLSQIMESELYEQGEVTGEVPLTPIQKQFYEWNLSKEEYFNQSIVLKSKAEINLSILEETLRAVVSHHDILRAVFKGGRQIIQRVNESKLYELKVFELYGQKGEDLLGCIEQECNKIQSSINLSEGPLLKLGLFKTDDADHLMICIHHLVVDGISWRVLLEDITEGYKQYSLSGKIEFPKKTASYKMWSGMLLEYANSSKLRDELRYWQEIKKKSQNNRIIGETSFSDIGNIAYETMKLSKEDTSNLLYSVNKAYNTEIGEVLLTGLSMAVKDTFGVSGVTVLMEGHGREELQKELFIDRTVGWFTSIYPVVLETKNNLEKDITATKETLRKIPNHGIGYGVLKYLRNNDIGVETDITFNYLGDFGTVIKDDSVMQSSEINGGEPIAKENRFGTDISINGSISCEVLSFTITYNEYRYSGDVIKQLSDNYVSSLHAIIEHCMAVEETGVTASDLGDTTDLGDDEWEAMLQAYSTEE